MSGPKVSIYEIKRRQKEEKRKKQIQEINDRLIVIREKLQLFQKEYKELSNEVIKNINKKISLITDSLSGDLRVAFKELRKLEKFVEEEHRLLQEDKTFYDRLKFQKRQKEKRINSLLKEFDEIKKEYQEIINDAISQRIETFKKAIKLNPDNENLLNQMEDFKVQLSKMYANYLEKMENTKYVANAFKEILGAKGEEEGGSIVIDGNVDGVPIKVRLSYKNSDIRFDTPEDGSCQKAMEKIVKELKQKEINLGPIKALKTGKLFNTLNHQIKQRIRQ